MNSTYQGSEEGLVCVPNPIPNLVTGRQLKAARAVVEGSKFWIAAT